MKNITYLFGAGASCLRLPLVCNIKHQLKVFIEKIGDKKLQMDSSLWLGKNVNITHTKAQIQKFLINDFQWLLKICEDHASIDTAAKKLYITNQDQDLIRLKVLLSIFLEIEQLNQKPDPRYDVFFASLLNQSYVEFPKNIRILSWNYDSQFEIAHMDYVPNKNYDHSKHFLNVINKYDYDKRHSDVFTIYKLNGVNGFYKQTEFERHHSLYSSTTFSSELDLSTMSNILFWYHLNYLQPKKYFPSISFAWENQAEDHSIVNLAMNGIKETNVLVIIGYSFPFFNRSVDRTLINSMTQLEHVYIQSKETANIKDRMSSVMGSDQNPVYHLIDDVEQFYSPPQL